MSWNETQHQYPNREVFAEQDYKKCYLQRLKCRVFLPTRHNELNSPNPLLDLREFPKTKLFDKTDHQAIICNELIKIAIILEEFYNIFGPELKAVTGEPKRIEEVTNRVRSLIVKIRSIPFEIFEILNLKKWQKVMEEFNHEVAEIESEAKVFINQSFKKLRSSEGAFEMLLRFKNIRSREAINNELMKKFTDILTQYVKECDQVFDIFLKYKSDPPLYKNHPVVSGAIAWARFLFKSIKRPMLKFLTVEDLMNTEQGKEVH